MLKNNIVVKNKKLVVLVALGFAVWFFFLRDKLPTVIVKKVELQNKIITKNVSASGDVESKSQADMAFPLSGRVSYIAVEEGDTVVRGQFLASIDLSSARQTAQSYKDARDIALREKEFFIDRKWQNISTYGGTRQYEMKLREMEERVSQAEAQYQAQLASISNGNLYAPISGTVINVSKKQGEIAAMGETIATVSDLTDLQFIIYLDQEDYGFVKIGQNVDLKLNTYDEVVFNGTITELPYFADPTTKNFELKIKFNETNGHPVLAGMEGDAYIILATTTTEVPALTIDDISYDQDSKPFVWVSRQNKLVKLPIETGLEGDIYTQILTNIEDVIVVSAKDNQKLDEGYITKIIN